MSVTRPSRHPWGGRESAENPSPSAGSIGVRPAPTYFSQRLVLLLPLPISEYVGYKIVLEALKVTHAYGEQTAIDDVSFEVGERELVSIVGTSGCGKSTLLRIIAGLIAPTAGEIRFYDRPVTGVPDGLAVVFQDYSRSLLPWMSVRDNVTFPLRRRGLDKAARRHAAENALESVGLADAAKKFPWQLSGGMQQRVAIARALAYRPSLLLMDEPFGSVDAQTREDLEDLLLQVRAANDMTILLVTHDIDESVYVSDRVLVLGRSPGQVIADLEVDLPSKRDRIETRELPNFVHMRSEVGRLVRDNTPGDPSVN
jgi:NitT/TauT family transport system ATP-binding protein